MPIIGRDRLGRALLLLGVLLTISVVAVLYHLNGWDVPGDTPLDGAPSGIVKAGGLLAPLAILSVTLMVLVVEGGKMVADAFRERLHQTERRRGREEGLEAGREEGLEAGREEERAKWQDWLERKQAAELENRPFDEPPPGSE